MALTAVFLELSVLLTIAVIAHFFMKRFRQPTIVGEIAIGILLGPSLIGFMRPVPGEESTVTVFASLGAIFLLFILGLESDDRALFRRRNIAIAAGGVILPWIAGFAVAFALVPDFAIPATANRFSLAVFVGAALVAPSTALPPPRPPRGEGFRPGLGVPAPLRRDRPRRRPLRDHRDAPRAPLLQPPGDLGPRAGPPPRAHERGLHDRHGGGLPLRPG